MVTLLDHISLPVQDLESSSRFYDAVLSVLGIENQRSSPTFAAYGAPGDLAPSFWLLRATNNSATAGMGLHVSFRARTQEAVNKFYDTALAMGAKSAGAPGLRPQYTANFYGAFVIDPNGFKIEATHRHP
ncbi:MAG: VOC family protein [Pseudomonadales bacterium]